MVGRAMMGLTKVFRITLAIMLSILGVFTLASAPISALFYFGMAFLLLMSSRISNWILAKLERRK